MEENPLSPPLFMEGRIRGIKFSIATHEEICTASISDCPISHSSQLTNPFLGLPLESGKCEACGTSEHGKCEGHFGFIQLPIPIFHPCHVSELKRVLSLMCLKCLHLKKGKINGNSSTCVYCRDVPPMSIKDVKTTDGALCLELKVPAKARLRDGIWNFLEIYGFRYGDTLCRSLLPFEALQILNKVPEDTKKKLAGKGYYPQNGFILQCLPVPPNCLSVPDISNGISVIASDHSTSMLKKVLNKVETIKRSRSGSPNFESHEIEANELQSSIGQYINLRGTTKAPHDITRKFAVGNEDSNSSTKAWLEKMRTLFLSKGSGFSSRCVITGDSYKGIQEIGVPFEIAQKITFEEKVTVHNMKRLQEMVDMKLCVTYKDGSSTYAIAVGSKGHTSLKVGQVINRRIMDGDIVFINRPPSTHKHSLQSFSVYVHEDHTVKINPLICAPLGADFDGDCIHLFYPQSLAAKAEVQELFSVEKQLLSSHSGSLNLQLVNDCLLSLKLLFKTYFVDRRTAQQLAMCTSHILPEPALTKGHHYGPFWTGLQILQTAMPACLDSSGERHLIRQSEIIKVDFNRDVLQSSFTEIVTSILDKKGPKEALQFFNSLQPLLMEILFSQGYSIGLKDFAIPRFVNEDTERRIQDVSPLLHYMRATNSEVELQVEDNLKNIKQPIVNFILKSSALGNLIDSKSDSAISKIVQQLGFLGLQLFDSGKFYSKALVEDMYAHFQKKYSTGGVDYSSEAFGLIKSSFFHGLNPYEDMVHSIASRELIVRSSKGLTEPGTLFKNLMAILRDVVICYDGTVRNVCSNSIIQFDYGREDGTMAANSAPAGEPVGVLAATAISNPAYKAVLDSSQSSTLAWEMMKEILLCKVNLKNDVIDRRVILYLNDCSCGKKNCKENAAYSVLNQLKRVTLNDVAIDFLIEYQKQRILPEGAETDAGLVGHIHLDKVRLHELNRSMDEIVQACQEIINSYRKKKNKFSQFFKRISLSSSEFCSLQQCDGKWCQSLCLQFLFQDGSNGPDGDAIERVSQIMAHTICPILLNTVVKGDPKVNMAKIIWISPDTPSWVRNPCAARKGELALEVVVEKGVVKKHGDAWRIVLDSCIPVMHLIDTRRSIPYGIQQLKELLGISCAFDQSVQRLSRSMRSVAKGVLKEHLVLLANSMTCSGNLIGFNIGGYKALFRSLKVQVPFTEATLFTPMKCFEKAAAKCCTDSLSSMVASCSWGKHVALGTGAKFQIMWNKQEMEVNEEDGTDVYNFLHLVRTTSSEREVDTGCLGADVDDLEEEIRNMELNMSPENNLDFDKLSFDDTAEVEGTMEGDSVFENGKSSVSIWGKAAASVVKANGWQQWGTDKNIDSDNNDMQVSKPNVWSSWDGKKKTQENPAGKMSDESCRFGDSNSKEDETKQSNQSDRTDSWGKWGANSAEKERGQNASWGQWGSNDAKMERGEAARSSWNSEKERRQENAAKSSWGQPTQSTKSSWDQRTQTDKTDTWGANSAASESGQSASFGNWVSNEAKFERGEDAKSSWNSEKEGKQKNAAKSSWGQPTQSTKSSWDQPTQMDKTEGWGKREANSAPSESGQSASFGQWESNDAKFDRGEAARSSWGNEKGKTQENAANSSWGKPPQSDKKDYWGKGGANVAELERGKPTAWGQGRSNDQKFESGEAAESGDNGSDRWDKNSMQSQVGQTKWSADDSPNEADMNCNQWDKPKETPIKSDPWNENVMQNRSSSSHLVSNTWGSQISSEIRWPSSKGGWNENRADDQKNQSTKSHGWSSSDNAEWKKQKKPVKLDDQTGRNESGIFTATGRRMDTFTSDEEKILSLVEPVMQSIRRILHNSSEGDQLSPDDQLYVLENVFEYHPDKATKMGEKVDYVMVDKHTNFQGTRCFYVVSTNGSRADFSYLKCMKNFVQEKFPDEGESFSKKYFRNNRSEAPGNENR